MRGIGVEEIAEATKIGSRSLRALEEEHFEQLPGGIFNRGFVRAYARYLGIDEEQAVTDYLSAEAAHGGFVPATGPTSADNASPLRATREGGANWLAAALALLVLVLGIGGWRWYSARREHAAAATAAPIKKTVPQTSAAAPTVTATAAPASPATSAGNTTANIAGSPAAPAAAPASTAPATTTGDAPPQAKASPELTSANDGFVVKVRARERSWMSLTSDDAAAQEVTLEPATEKSIHAARRLVLKIGNLPGVEVSFNGQPVALVGGDKVKNLVFTDKGLQP